MKRAMWYCLFLVTAGLAVMSHACEICDKEEKKTGIEGDSKPVDCDWVCDNSYEKGSHRRNYVHIENVHIHDSNINIHGWAGFNAQHEGDRSRKWYSPQQSTTANKATVQQNRYAKF